MSKAGGTAERDLAQAMIRNLPERHRITIGGDRKLDTAGFAEALLGRNATTHVAQNTSNRSSAIDRRTTRHSGYAASHPIPRRQAHPQPVAISRPKQDGARSTAISVDAVMSLT